MSEQNQERPRLALKPVEIVVGAGAAIVTAFASSALGVAGTVGGAAVASVLTTVSSTVLRHSAERTNESLRRTNGRLRQTLAYRTGRAGVPSGAPGAGRTITQVSDIDDRARAAHRTEDIGWPAEDESIDNTTTPDQAGDTAPTGTGPGGSGRRWAVLVGAAVAVFVLAMGGITGLESIIGKPLSSLFGHGQDSGSSVGHVFGGEPRTTPTRPAPSTTPATGPSSTASQAPSPTTPPASSAAPAPPPAATSPASTQGQNTSPSP
jgi:hypothetical protein